jgi:hypothetical protein
MLTSAGLTDRQTSGLSDFSYMAVGTGSQTPAENLTALETELDRSPISGKDVVGALSTLTALFTNNQANGAITEVGVFDAAEDGNLLQYELLVPSQVKTSDDGLIVVIPTTLANA